MSTILSYGDEVQKQPALPFVSPPLVLLYSHLMCPFSLTLFPNILYCEKGMLIISLKRIGLISSMFLHHLGGKP